MRFMYLSRMARPLFRVSPLSIFALAFVACGGGNTKPATNGEGPSASSSDTPKVIIEDSTEVWYDETSGPAAGSGKGTGVREYYRDVTRSTGVKGPFSADAGAPEIKKLRVIVRFPVPKVQPPDARDPHTVNRLLWEARAQIAACFYKGAGKEAGNELTMVGFLQVDKKGDVTAAGIETTDPALKQGAVDECIIENVKGLAFIAAGDDTKIRFKLKLQTIDGEGLADFKDPAK